jgi:hypothetical protein
MWLMCVREGSVSYGGVDWRWHRHYAFRLDSARFHATSANGGHRTNTHRSLTDRTTLRRRQEPRLIVARMLCVFVCVQRLQEKERERKYKKRMQQRRSAAAANRASDSQPAGLSKKNAKGQRVPLSPDGARATPQPAALSTHSDNRPPMLLYFSPSTRRGAICNAVPLVRACSSSFAVCFLLCPVC